MGTDLGISQGVAIIKATARSPAPRGASGPVRVLEGGREGAHGRDLRWQSSFIGRGGLVGGARGGRSRFIGRVGLVGGACGGRGSFIGRGGLLRGA